MYPEITFVYIYYVYIYYCCLIWRRTFSSENNTQSENKYKIQSIMGQVGHIQVGINGGLYLNNMRKIEFF